MSIRVKYDKGLYNETVKSEDKKYLISILNDFTEMSFLRDI